MEMEVIIDQYIFGAFLVSLSGFILLYSQLRRKPKKCKSSSNFEPKNGDYIKTSADVNLRGDSEHRTDIVIVGAGVAGSALAYTLAKVNLKEKKTKQNVCFYASTFAAVRFFHFHFLSFLPMIMCKAI